MIENIKEAVGDLLKDTAMRTGENMVIKAFETYVGVWTVLFAVEDSLGQALGTLFIQVVSCVAEDTVANISVRATEGYTVLGAGGDRVNHHIGRNHRLIRFHERVGLLWVPERVGVWWVPERVGVLWVPERVGVRSIPWRGRTTK